MSFHRQQDECTPPNMTLVKPIGSPFHVHHRPRLARAHCPPGCRPDRTGGPGPRHQPFQPAGAGALVSLAQGCLWRELHRAGLCAHRVLCGVVHRAGTVGFCGGSLQPAPGAVCRPGPAGRGLAGLCCGTQLLDAAVLRGAGGLALAVLAVLWFYREVLSLPSAATATASSKPVASATGKSTGPAAGGLDFLRIPAVWMCFAFFLFYAMALSVVQTFAPEAARQLHAVPVTLVAVCLTIYMVASAGGMVLGGFLASDPTRCERIVAVGIGLAALVALSLALAPVPASLVPVLFGFMGFANGIAGPSRDLLVKRSTPENATGRVYGVVYAGLDIGQAISPLVFGRLMDHGQYTSVLVGLALVQAVLIASAFNVRRVRRTAAGLQPA